MSTQTAAVTDQEMADAMASTEFDTPPVEVILELDRLSLFYGDTAALVEISMAIVRNAVTAIIGPSGCGKSSLLRCVNRMNDLVPAARVTGAVRFLGHEIYHRNINPMRLRRHIGMIFQRSTPFPRSVFENVAYGLRLHGLAKSKAEMERKVEESLRRAALWDEVKDRLGANALTLSGGQQQRLCIARTLAIEPEMILMDEPASALDPIATARIEELIGSLRKDFTILMVTHNLQQAGRCSDYTAFLHMGQLVEYSDTESMFSRPQDSLTESYIAGRFG